MAFERDLGYLDKFFDNLDAHAGTLGGEGGARLKQLVGEERARWTEIRALLGGPSQGGGKAARPKGDEAAAAKAPPSASVNPSAPAALAHGASSGAQTDVTSAATRSPVGGFTVGSLRGR